MLPPRTDWAEQIPPNEEAEHVAYAELLRDLHAGRERGRALHVKAHAGLRGELRTRADLPAAYAVGIFASAGRYPAYVRFSSSAGRSQADRIADVRGIAVKIVGVPGTKLIPGMEAARTQDLLMNRTPTLPFRDVREFVRAQQIGKNPLHLLPALLQLGPARALQLVRQALASLKGPPVSLTSLRYWSGAATRWGEHAARTSLIPVDASDEPHRGEGPHALRDALRQRLRTGAIHYTLGAQLYVDAQRTPIEDSTVDWPEADSPYLPIADLVLPQQDLDSDEARKVAAYVETLSFDPWHAPLEFRPLGRLMRARNHAYRLSVIARAAAPEPDGSESFL